MHSAEGEGKETLDSPRRPGAPRQQEQLSYNTMHDTVRASGLGRRSGKVPCPALLPTLEVGPKSVPGEETSARTPAYLPGSTVSADCRTHIFEVRGARAGRPTSAEVGRVWTDSLRVWPKFCRPNVLTTTPAALGAQVVQPPICGHTDTHSWPHTRPNALGPTLGPHRPNLAPNGPNLANISRKRAQIGEARVRFGWISAKVGLAWAKLGQKQAPRLTLGNLARERPEVRGLSRSSFRKCRVGRRAGRQKRSFSKGAHVHARGVLLGGGASPVRGFRASVFSGTRATQGSHRAEMGRPCTGFGEYWSCRHGARRCISLLRSRASPSP